MQYTISVTDTLNPNFNPNLLFENGNGVKLNIRMEQLQNRLVGSAVYNILKHSKGIVRIYSTNPEYSQISGLMRQPTSIKGLLELCRSQRLIQQPSVVYVPSRNMSDALWENGHMAEEIRANKRELTLYDLLTKSPTTTELYSVWSTIDKMRVLIAGAPTDLSSGEFELPMTHIVAKMFWNKHTLKANNGLRVRQISRRYLSQKYGILTRKISNGIPISVSPEILTRRETGESQTWIRIINGFVLVSRKLGHCVGDQVVINSNIPKRHRLLLEDMLSNAHGSTLLRRNR